MSWTGWALISLAVLIGLILAEAKWRQRKPRRLSDTQPAPRSHSPLDVPLGMEATDLETIAQIHRANQKADDHNRSISRKLSR